MKPAAAPLSNRAGLFRQTEPPLSSLLDAIRSDLLTSDVAAIYADEEWSQVFMLEDDGANMDDRIRAYQDWLRGEAWRRAAPELVLAY